MGAAGDEANGSGNGSRSGPGTAGGMTIDELSRRSGATTRNIRAYQTRGLLPPPRMVGRVGHYDDGHLARLAYIAQLQQRGFSLASIQQLLGGWEEGRSLGDVLGLEQAIHAPWSDETPERFGDAELQAVFPEVLGDPTLVARAVELGLVRPLEGGGWEAPSPRMLRVGAELVAAGIPLSEVLDEHLLLLADMRRVARRMVKLVERHVWEPFVNAGLPASRLPQVTRAVERIRPTAAAAVLSALARAMEAEVAASAAEQAARFVPKEGNPGERKAAEGGR